MSEIKLTRHNGRSGSHGVYNPKHNDRRFELENSEHIDRERAQWNIYWDCYTGLSTVQTRPPDQRYDFSFERIESLFYFEHYDEFVQAQNERNEKNRHTERNRTVADLLADRRTCPEESIYQIGTVEESVSGEQLAEIAADFFNEMEEKFGSNVHILDWALHLDEGTPHIHERHVFDAKNKYGELCPQQEKALEELGIPLPDPNKKKGRNNNRKQTFDAECRRMLFEISERHGLHLQTEPTYGGRGYLEKQNFIIEKQKETIAAQQLEAVQNSEVIASQQSEVSRINAVIASRQEAAARADGLLAKQQEEMKKREEELEEKAKELAEKQTELNTVMLKISDVDSLVDEVADNAYRKACEVVADTVRAETQKEDIALIEDYKNWVTAPERKTPEDKKRFIGKCLDVVQDKLRNAAQGVLDKVQSALRRPEVRAANTGQIRETAKESILARLAKAKAEADQQNRSQMREPERTGQTDKRNKKQNMEH